MFPIVHCDSRLLFFGAWSISDIPRGFAEILAEVSIGVLEEPIVPIASIVRLHELHFHPYDFSPYAQKTTNAKNDITSSRRQRGVRLGFPSQFTAE